MIVVLLLIDGLGYHFLHQAPFWQSHTVFPLKNTVPTITAPNWWTILTGKGPEKHGITVNEQVSRPSYRYTQGTLVDDALQTGFQVTFISDWAMMRKILPLSNPNITFVHTRQVWSAATTALKQTTKKKKTLIVINYSRLDTVGHTTGWDSLGYQRSLQRLDRATHHLYTELVAQEKPFLLCGTADHGGHGLDHEEAHEPSIRQVPWLCVQSGVVKHRRSTRKFRCTKHIRPWLKTHAFN